jgi:tetratricopeptide (TPR) repeat protein
MINFADSLAWNNKGNALRNLGRYEEAIRAFDVSIELIQDLRPPGTIKELLYMTLRCMRRPSSAMIELLA